MRGGEEKGMEGDRGDRRTCVRGRLGKVLWWRKERTDVGEGAVDLSRPLLMCLCSTDNLKS